MNTPQTELARRLYARMLVCPCEFARNCVQCQLDLGAIREAGEFDGLARIDPAFVTDMENVEAAKV